MASVIALSVSAQEINRSPPPSPPLKGAESSNATGNNVMWAPEFVSSYGVKRRKEAEEKEIV